MYRVRDAQIAKVQVDLTTPDGTPIVPTSFVWSLYDEIGTVLVADTSVAVSETDTSVVVTVSGSDNTLATGNQIESRELLAKVVDTSGVEHTLRAYYIVANTNRLVSMVNSLVTYPQALRLSMDFADLRGWQLASQEQREAALVQAFGNLTLLKLSPDYFPSEFISLIDMADADFQQVDAKIRDAFQRAQLVEANVLLGGDGTDLHRKSGIMSQSVGESTTFFRTIKPVDLPISKQALKLVSRYLDMSIKLARA